MRFTHDERPLNNIPDAKPREGSYIWGLEREVSNEELKKFGRLGQKMPTEAQKSAREEKKEKKRLSGIGQMVVGIDLGKQSDATVMVVVEPSDMNNSPTYLVHKVVPVALGTPYTDIARAIVRLDGILRKKKNVKEVIYCIDSGGADPMVDVIDEAMPHADIYRMYVTSGRRAHVSDYERNIPKPELVNTLKKVLEDDRIRFEGRLITGRFNEGMKLLKAEIDNFQMRVQESGWDKYEAGTGHHDDAVSALMLAIWWLEREAGLGPLRLF